PLGVAGGARSGLHVADFAAELEGVLSMQIGDVVENLEILVRPDDLGPVASQERESLNADTRLAVKERVGYARVNGVAGRDSVRETPRGVRVGIVVSGEKRQTIVRVSHFELVHIRRVRDKGPASRAHSRSHGKERLGEVRRDG